jgi:serine/threonine protein kinase
MVINNKLTPIGATPLSLSMKKIKSFHGNRKMSMDKQIFVSEGRGRIDQKYDFLETLGQGGFGLVRKVRHKITGELRAMKVI